MRHPRTKNRPRTGSLPAFVAEKNERLREAMAKIDKLTSESDNVFIKEQGAGLLGALLVCIAPLAPEIKADGEPVDLKPGELASLGDALVGRWVVTKMVESLARSATATSTKKVEKGKT